MPPFFPLQGVLVAVAGEAQRKIAASAAAITFPSDFEELSIDHFYGQEFVQSIAIQFA